MNRKHFTAFAKRIKEQYQITKDIDSDSLRIAINQMHLVIRISKQFNKKFNEKSFIKACGLCLP